MKRDGFVFFAAVMTLVLLISGISCSDADNNSDGGAAFSYSFLTENRGYIGGSLIWNPGSAAGQLSVGTKVAVRLGKLSPVSDNTVYYGDVGSTEVTITTKDSDITHDKDWASGSEVGRELTASVKEALSGTSGSKVMYEDDPSQAVYGYLSVNTIDSTSVSLTFTQVNKDGSSSSMSRTLKTEESWDINGDRYNDVKYTKPDIQRTGYEDARWLTFLNEPKDPVSCMYFTFTAAEARAGYRATTREAARVEAGLYGVNSDGDFIYICEGDSPTEQPGWAYGDYLLCTEACDGWEKAKAAYGSDEIKPFDADGNENPAFYAEETAAEIQNQVTFKADDDSYNRCYVITRKDENGNLGCVNRPNYASHSVDYDYQLYQFPDQVNGPGILLKSLAEDAAVKEKILALNGGGKELPVAAADAIAWLNKAIADTGADGFFAAVVKAKVIDAEAKEDYNDYVAQEKCIELWTAVTSENKKNYCRLLIDELYDDSPDAVVEEPDLENIYPSMVANVGSTDELDRESMRACRNAVAEIIDREARAISQNYEEFKKNREVIQNQWKKFVSFDLVGLMFGGDAEAVKKSRVAKAAGFEFCFGLKGAITNPSGQFRVDVGAALYANIDLSLNSLANAGIEGAATQPAQGQMNKCLKTLFEGKKNTSVVKTDVEMQLGPIPIVFGCNVQLGFDFDVGNFNPHLCFVGLYGGEAWVDVRYGIEWFLRPYVRPSAGAKALYPTELYVGLEKEDSGKGYDISFGPWVRITPSVGIGKSFLSARVSTPVKLGSQFKLHIADTLNTVDFKKAALTVQTDFVPYVELNFKIISFKKEICRVPLLDHELVLYDADKGIPNPNKITFKKRGS